MGKILFAILFIICGHAAWSNHVKGGYIRYEYLGAGSSAGTSQYRVTVTVFYGCGVQGPKNSVTLIAKNASTGASVLSTAINTTTSTTVTKTSYSPCMSNPPTICYEIYTYVTTITLADNSSGYVLAVTDQYRTANIINISNSSATGIAITAQISGTVSNVDYHTNTSPVFAFKDTALVCYNGVFSYQFSASDPVDGDSVSYSFGNGLNVNASGSLPFYTSLNYNSGYSGAAPMGAAVTINPATGLISGAAPAVAGEYVIAVYVNEWRNGVLIDAIKKELQIYVYTCTLTAATLDVSYINCDNYVFNFANESSASNITTYNWDFGVTNITTDVSTEPMPTYTYPDTGTYTLKLKVGNSGGCEDSTTAMVKVYPGFKPGFTVSGSCYQSPFTFTDTTRTQYGTVNSWSWNFGDASTAADVSALQNPSYQYAAAGNATVTLIVGSSKGCIDTATQVVAVNDKPQIILPFSDTLICSGDKLPLIVQGSGTSFSWTPLYNIANANTANPIVAPNDTTVYTVTVSDKACVDSAKVTVNVLDFITVSLATDTAICATDSIVLYPKSDALSYLWSESPSVNTLSDINVKHPSAAPLQTTVYTVNANLGHCQAQAQTTVYVSPYPTVSVGADTSICFGSSATLHGYTLAAGFSWNPTSHMQNASTLNPIVSPAATTSYTLSATDTFYCPKPSTAIVKVTVIPPVVVNAGNDTSVVIGQPLQFAATTTATQASFLWTPSSYLNNANIYNPIAYITPVESVTYHVKATTPQGCTGSDDVTVFVYKTLPSIFVPTGFTPNGDGLNDVLKPILAGIAEFNYFRVYNRWGQLVFQTAQQGQGWDGTVNGVQQATGTFVFAALGIDYLGKKVENKGSVELIR